MPIEYSKNTARFTDIVSVEEAEGLLDWLQRQKKPQVDFSACTHLHAANLQVLMAARPAIAAWPQDEAFAHWLRNTLTQGE
jgi:hypothetical protein